MKCVKSEKVSGHPHHLTSPPPGRLEPGAVLGSPTWPVLKNKNSGVRKTFHANARIQAKGSVPVTSRPAPVTIALPGARRL